VVHGNCFVKQSVVTVFQELCNCENGLYITEFECTFKETVYLQNMTLLLKTKPSGDSIRYFVYN